MKINYPFKNPVDIHSFNNQIVENQVPVNVRDVILAYAIIECQSQVSTPIKLTVNAVKALDEHKFDLAIGLINSPTFLRNIIKLDNLKIIKWLFNYPVLESQTKRSSRVVSFVRTSNDPKAILSISECEKIYVQSLSLKSVPCAMAYINSNDYSINSRNDLIEQVLKISLIPSPIPSALESLSKLSLEDSDINVIKCFANGISNLTTPTISPNSIAAAHDLLLVRYIQQGQIPDAIKLNKNALTLTLSHGIGNVKRTQLINESWKVLPKVQKVLVEREVGKNDEEREIEDVQIQIDDVNNNSLVDNKQQQPSKMESWIDVRLEQESKMPSTPFAPLKIQQKPQIAVSSPLSGPPRISTPNNNINAPNNTPLKQTLTTKHKHNVESPFAQLLGKSIAREKEREKEREMHDNSLNRSVFEIPSVTDIANRSIVASTPIRKSTPLRQSIVASPNESKDKITDLPDIQNSVRRPRQSSVISNNNDNGVEDEDNVPGSYPYTPAPKQQQPRRNLRSTTLRSSNRCTSTNRKRPSDDVVMSESDDDEVNIPGSYIPTPAPNRTKKGNKSSGSNTTKHNANNNTRRSSRRSSATNNINNTVNSTTTKRQTRSSTRTQT